jgi:hypothetical protein
MPKSKHWIIDIPGWGIHLMTGTKKQANEWMVAKAQWEDCEIAHMTEVPLWLYKSYRWHKKNEIAFNVAIHKTLEKDVAQKVLKDRDSRLQEYLKEKD